MTAITHVVVGHCTEAAAIVVTLNNWTMFNKVRLWSHIKKLLKKLLSLLGSICIYALFIAGVVKPLPGGKKWPPIWWYRHQDRP